MTTDDTRNCGSRCQRLPGEPACTQCGALPGDRPPNPLLDAATALGLKLANDAIRSLGEITRKALSPTDPQSFPGSSGWFDEQFAKIFGFPPEPKPEPAPTPPTVKTGSPIMLRLLPHGLHPVGPYISDSFPGQQVYLVVAGDDQ
jgi:hypothetical protein